MESKRYISCENLSLREACPKIPFMPPRRTVQRCHHMSHSMSFLRFHIMSGGNDNVNGLHDVYMYIYYICLKSLLNHLKLRLKRSASSRTKEMSSCSGCCCEYRANTSNRNPTWFARSASPFLLLRLFSPSLGFGLKLQLRMF